jgi:hypothetical protein
LGNKFVRRKKKHHTQFLFYFVLLILAFLLQTSVFPLLPFLSASPNLLLILCFSFGFYSLIFVFIGYANGYFHAFYYEEYIQLPLFLCVLSGLAYHSYIYLLRFLIRGKWNLPYYAVHIVLPSIVFSFLLTLIMYRFFFSASKQLEEKAL